MQQRRASPSLGADLDRARVTDRRASSNSSSAIPVGRFASRAGQKRRTGRNFSRPTVAFFPAGAANGALTTAGRVESAMRTVLSFSGGGIAIEDWRIAGTVRRNATRRDATRGVIHCSKINGNNARCCLQACGHSISENLTVRHQRDMNGLFTSSRIWGTFSPSRNFRPYITFLHQPANGTPCTVPSYFITIVYYTLITQISKCRKHSI